MNYYNFNNDHIRRSVLDFMRQNDILPANLQDQDIILDGVLHRFRTREDNQGETTGAYCIFLDHWPAGWVQDWRKGDSIPWSFKRDELDDNGKSYFDDETYKRNLELSRKHQQELLLRLEQQKAEASEKARSLFEQIDDNQVPQFPYIINKNINTYGVKFLNKGTHDECMLIPLYDINGRIQSIQYISADGSKKYFPHAPVKGGFFPFHLPDNPDIILVGEGYATMATVHDLSGLPCIAAMDCGNLIHVCEALKGKFPKARIIITADNDHNTESNPGISRAHSVRDKLGIQGVVTPDFSNDDNGSDWNDYTARHGYDKAKRVLRDKISIALASKRTQEVLSRVELINAQDLRNIVFPPLKWAVDGFLPAGCSILAGGPKVGKSILSLHLSLGVAIGGCVLGKIDVRQGDVLYLALEDTQRRLQERINGSGLPEDIDLSRLTLATDVPRQHEGGMEFLLWWLNYHHDARLVIIDTLQKFRKQLSGKGDRYAEDYDVISDIKALSDKFNVPVLIIHHTKKAFAEDWVNEISGTTGIAGATDTLFTLKRSRTDNNGILHRTGRDVEEKDFAMHLDGYGWILDGDAALFTMPEWKRQILDFLKEHNSVSPKNLAEAFNMNINTAQQNLRRLVREGVIRKYGYGTYELVEK